MQPVSMLLTMLSLVLATSSVSSAATGPQPKRLLFDLQLHSSNSADAATGANDGDAAAAEEDAPLERHQGVVPDMTSYSDLEAVSPNEPMRAMKTWPRSWSPWGPESGSGMVAGIAGGNRRLARYRSPKAALNHRRRKLKVLRREPLLRPFSDQRGVYVVDETMTGYAAESPMAAGSGIGSQIGEFEQLGEAQGKKMMSQPPPPSDTSLMTSSWLDDDNALLVRHRLQKLDFYFSLLRVLSEDCRQRMLCEVAREPDRFSPLAAILGEVTRTKLREKLSVD